MSFLVIRLRRAGRWKAPIYDIVVATRHKRVNGPFFEKIGFYSPISSHSQKIFFISLERLAFWLLKGAHIRRRVGRLLGNLSSFSVETMLNHPRV